MSSSPALTTSTDTRRSPSILRRRSWRRYLSVSLCSRGFGEHKTTPICTTGSRALAVEERAFEFDAAKIKLLADAHPAFSHLQQIRELESVLVSLFPAAKAKNRPSLKISCNVTADLLDFANAADDREFRDRVHGYPFPLSVSPWAFGSCRRSLGVRLTKKPGEAGQHPRGTSGPERQAEDGGGRRFCRARNSAVRPKGKIVDHEPLRRGSAGLKPPDDRGTARP